MFVLCYACGFVGPLRMVCFLFLWSFFAKGEKLFIDEAGNPGKHCQVQDYVRDNTTLERSISHSPLLGVG